MTKRKDLPKLPIQPRHPQSLRILFILKTLTLSGIILNSQKIKRIQTSQQSRFRRRESTETSTSKSTSILHARVFLIGRGD